MDDRSVSTPQALRTRARRLRSRPQFRAWWPAAVCLLLECGSFANFAVLAAPLTAAPGEDVAPDRISWSTVDGGGTETAASGVVTLGGTAGQADAGAVLASGGYTLRGGFWPGQIALSRGIFADGFESGDAQAWSSVP